VLRVDIAEGGRLRGDAERVRARVYCDEERMLDAGSAARRASGGDSVEIELVVYSAEEPVGALRLRIAPAHAPVASLPLASKFRLRGFERSNVVGAEIGGFCVLRRYRGTRAAALLFGALRAESERRGVTHWLAAANTETDCAEDAAIAYRLLRSRRLVSGAFSAEPTAVEPLPAAASRFIYTADERAQAARGELETLRLPKVLALFATKMGARYIGAPVYDRDFNVFATPLAVELASPAAPTS